MMGRKNKRKPTKAQPLPAVSDPKPKIGDPTKEQQRHATYVETDIIHAESFTRATVHRIRQASALRALWVEGQLTDDQYYSAAEIARVAEMIERNTAVQCASLEARVDYAGSAKDVLVERLGMVRLEIAYTKWRTRIAMPRRMIVDMVIEDRSLFATARVYRVGWPKAKRLLRDALDTWTSLMIEVRRDVDQEDLDKAHMRACA